MTWLFGTFACYFTSMCVEGLILRQSLKGTILQPATRRSVIPLLYAHFAITVADVAFTILGTLLDYHVGNSCYVRNHVHTAVVVVIVGNYFVIACHFLGVALIFSVFAHLPSEERWNRMFDILGCCLCLPESSEREREGRGTLSQIATCFGEVFQGADLVPSDIAAGLALLALQHRTVLEGEPLGWHVMEGKPNGERKPNERAKEQKERKEASGDAGGKSGGGSGSAADGGITEPLLAGDGERGGGGGGGSDASSSSSSSLRAPMSPEAVSDTLAEAAHYARWALASYGWMLYTWANPTGGLAMACSCGGLAQCCCPCLETSHDGFGGGARGDASRRPDSLDRAALKTCAGIQGSDLFYVSFTNGVGEQPYFIARDVARRAVVVSVRGTMSAQDCVTDSMYKPVLLNADAIGMPHLSGSQLHCHAGVVTATNFILSDLERHRVLHRVLLGEKKRRRGAGGGGGADDEDDALGDDLPESAARGHEGWTLVLCGHSLGAGIATVLSLHLRATFPNLRVWGIEPPGGLLSAELAEACGAWTVSTTHGCDLITRLSGPCLLKLRRDLMDALVRCKVNKFSLFARMTFGGARGVEESDVLLPRGRGAHEATQLRRAFERFDENQVRERPLMAAELYPPGRLLHLRRLPTGRRRGGGGASGARRRSLAEQYEARWVTARELMRQGLLVNGDFFVDHFPDKVVAVLSELAMKYSAASGEEMSRHYSFSSSAIGGEEEARRDAGGAGASGGRGERGLMETLVRGQRSERGAGGRGGDD